MSKFFAFEADFVDSLRCIPMIVRHKLDTVGVKLKLHHWNQFTSAQKDAMVSHPCDSNAAQDDYRAMIYQFIEAQGGDRPSDLPTESNPAWLNTQAIPESVTDQAASLGLAIHLNQWTALTPLQRFALIKLSRSNHENRNFLPALKEFGLYRTGSD